MTGAAPTSDCLLVERALAAMAADEGRLTLRALHTGVGCSAPTLRAAFLRVAGVSPARFFQTLRRWRGDWVLQQPVILPGEVVAAMNDIPPGVTLEPLDRAGENAPVSYGCADTPLGAAEIVWSALGIHAVHFPAGTDSLRARYAARIEREDPAAAAGMLREIFAPAPTTHFTLAVSGTPFQLDVWRALVQVPAGSTVSYSALALRLGKPASASRAVGGAVAANPVALLIPCHRVIRDTGALGDFRWGVWRKACLVVGERFLSSRGQ